MNTQPRETEDTEVTLRRSEETPAGFKKRRTGRSNPRRSAAVLILILVPLALATLGGSLLLRSVQRNAQPQLPGDCCGASRRLVFSDDFDNLDTIDLTATGAPGKKWFTDRPFGWGTTSARSLSVSKGILTIDQDTTSPNYAIGTTSPSSKAGKGFQYGYFEARIAFNPQDSKGTTGFPAFWGLSKDQITRGDMPRTAELDFFEAYRDGTTPFQSVYSGTVHDMLIGPPFTDRANYGNNTVPMSNIDWNQFHTYGCLWTPGRIVWYFDEKPMLTQEYSADNPPRPNATNLAAGTFSILDSDKSGQSIALGSGVNFPMRVDWVRVWQ